MQGGTCTSVRVLLFLDCRKTIVFPTICVLTSQNTDVRKFPYGNFLPLKVWKPRYTPPVFMRLRSKRFWMRAAARLLFWRENRLYRQTEVPSEGMAPLFHVKQRHGTNDEIVPRETSARNREGLFHVKPFPGGLCSTWNNVHAGKLMFHMKHFPQKETCRQKFWDSAFVFF